MNTNHKAGTLFLFVGSVALIFIAIIFTAVIDKSKQSAGIDTRARASKASSMTLLAKVESYDSTTNTLVATNVRFADTEGKTLGTWNITPPAKFNSAKFPSGTNIRIVASAATFQISTKTVTALEIER